MSTQTATRIQINRENLPKVIAKAFDLSKPQGMGILHFMPGPIPEDELSWILASADEAKLTDHKKIRLDYVQGRAVKLSIHYDEGSQHWYLEGDRWYDHSPAAWEDLKEYAQSL
jgi:hypothetical protein